MTGAAVEAVRLLGVVALEAITAAHGRVEGSLPAVRGCLIACPIEARMFLVALVIEALPYRGELSAETVGALVPAIEFEYVRASAREEGAAL